MTAPLISICIPAYRAERFLAETLASVRAQTFTAWEVIVTEDGSHERVRAVRELAPPGVPVVMSSATWHRYGVSVAPTFVLVDGATGRVLALGTAANGAEVLRLAWAETGS